MQWLIHKIWFRCFQFRHARLCWNGEIDCYIEEVRQSDPRRSAAEIQDWIYHRSRIVGVVRMLEARQRKRAS